MEARKVKRSEIFVPAKEECFFKNGYREAVAYFRNLGNKGKVNLGIAQLPNYPDIVWYALDVNRGRIDIHPAYKEHNPNIKRKLEPMDVFSVSTLKAGELFTRSKKIYYYDPDGFDIKKVSCFLNQDLVMMYAACQGLTGDNDYHVVKAYSIGSKREPLGMEWEIKNYDKDMILYLPMFMDDLPLFEDENGEETSPLALDFDYYYPGDTFFAHGKLWKVFESPQFKSKFILEAAPHLRIVKK